MITVVVYRGGRPVAGAHVIAVHKLGLWWAAAVTSPDGVARLTTMPGPYFVVAGDDLGNGAWVDGVEDGELAILNLVPKTRRRYFIEFEYRIPVADILARLLEALKQFHDKLVEFLSELASMLGITVPAVELARFVRLGEVEVRDPRTIRIYYEVLGSPVQVGPIIAAAARAILIIAVVVAGLLIVRWAFGEELPEILNILKVLAYGILASGVASLLVAATGFVRELRRP
jgi:hypothetical protein